MHVLFANFILCNEEIDGLNRVGHQKIEPAWELIFGHCSEASLATGPVIALPLVYPLLLTMTPALSSQYTKVPSGRRQGLRWRIMTTGWTFLRSF